MTRQSHMALVLNCNFDSTIFVLAKLSSISDKAEARRSCGPRWKNDWFNPTWIPNYNLFTEIEHQDGDYPITLGNNIRRQKRSRKNELCYCTFPRPHDLSFKLSGLNNI